MKDNDNITGRRAEIDRLDDEMLRLLNRRAQLASKLLSLKRGAGLPICDPQRELEVICRARESNQGPLDDRAVEKIFRRIVYETRRAEERENARHQNQNQRNERSEPERLPLLVGHRFEPPPGPQRRVVSRGRQSLAEVVLVDRPQPPFENLSCPQLQTDVDGGPHVPVSAA